MVARPAGALETWAMLHHNRPLPLKQGKGMVLSGGGDAKMGALRKSKALFYPSLALCRLLSNLYKNDSWQATKRHDVGICPWHLGKHLLRLPLGCLAVCRAMESTWLAIFSTVVVLDNGAVQSLQGYTSVI